jgi:hypothetical protein
MLTMARTLAVNSCAQILLAQRPANDVVTGATCTHMRSNALHVRSGCSFSAS